MSSLPKMFTLKHEIDTATLPMGTEFSCVYAPEPTTGDGWRVITFRVVPFRQPWAKTFGRGFRVIRKQPITEAEASTLYTRLYPPEGVPPA